jgi:hypothetical protein
MFCQFLFRELVSFVEGARKLGWRKKKDNETALIQ